MPAKILQVLPGGSLEPGALEELAAALKSCKIAAFPTDTVYGLGTTGLVKAGLRKIYQIKGRDAMKPLPILVHSKEEAQRWAQWSPLAEALARRFWPGALTLVLRPTAEGRILTFSEFPTVALRVPAHPIALAILEAAKVPLASSSANLSGSPAATSGTETAEVFRDLADFVVDAGSVPGIESTVVDATGEAPRVLRVGRWSREEILQSAPQNA